MNKREMLKGSVELVVLAELSRREMYGYQITKKLKESKDEILFIKEGALYPMLRRLEERGLVKGRWEKGTGRRQVHVYKITAEGKKELKARRVFWDDLVAAIKKSLKG